MRESSTTVVSSFISSDKTLSQVLVWMNTQHVLHYQHDLTQTVAKKEQMCKG